MSDRNGSLSGGEALPPTRSVLRWSGVVFAMVFPTVITWAYFVLAGRYSMSVQQATYLVVKIVQFAFPLMWVVVVLHEPLRTGHLTARGLMLGGLFGAAVVGAGWVVFDRLLRDAETFSQAAALINAKVAGFGIDSPWKYALLALFYSLFHSLLEEYYWRWFVFHQLRRLLPLWPAIAISALAFTAHHVIVLGTFFKGAPLLACLFASAVAMGGVFWAWLYERSGSLLGPWLSHLVIDAGIFWIGYELVRDALSLSG